MAGRGGNGGFIGTGRLANPDGMFSLATAFELALGGSGGPLALSFYENRNGLNIGSIDVYVVDSNGSVLEGPIYQASGNLGNVWNLIEAEYSAPSVDYHIAWHYVNGDGYEGDIALDIITIASTVYDFEIGSDGFLTTSGIDTADAATALVNTVTVPTATDPVQGRWNRDLGTTSSSGTGPSGGQEGEGSYYIYAETSNPNTTLGTNMWVFSPLITV